MSKRTYNNRTLVALVARRSVITGQLAKLSHDGWAGARPVDYQPLEAELAEINQRIAEIEKED